MVYSFRIRKTSLSTPPSNTTAGSDLIAPDTDFYTGYVYFRQRRDARVHRGYYQKSLVLLTSLPSACTVGLFTHLITVAGTRYHDYGAGAAGPTRVFLEAALQDLGRWPSPCYGATLEVPLAGQVLQIELPDHPHPGLQLLETSRISPLPTNETHLLASVPDGSSPGLLLHWWDRLTDIWTLWELVLLGEPLVVMAPDPATCSHVVTELVDLIKPIPYCGDYRPYLTIMDADHKSFINKRVVPCSTILGVTNPVFQEALAHWPHWIHLGPRVKPSGPTKGRSSQKRGVVTTHKSLITKDRNLIHHLTAAMLRGDRSATVLNNRLRRYFGELTERFLAPLNRYVATLLPTQWCGVQGKPPPSGASALMIS
ncbi:hypothetical protein DSO57_1001055 [Entomophthora muscae]|uniref:Uncharacterized protein n=1 Tax=Entomophthora muscae TaxID=34485 RepID=A0ACC2RP40_9FUNG|nr:hypothetical protein DSO57_1001055 [Entomophthora muscae]